MDSKLTRRGFIAASVVGTAALLVPTGFAMADEGQPPAGENAPWMGFDDAIRLYEEEIAANPELTDIQVWESVFSRLDPMGLSESEGSSESFSLRSTAVGSAEALLEQARSHVGYQSSGTNKFNLWYGWDHYEPWCDAFVSYCAADSGNAGIIGKFAYCPSHVNFFKNRGQWGARGSDVSLGDIIFFDWGGDGVADHVGIVEWCDGATVGTIEGNTGSYPGCVGRGSYSVWDHRILGYGRPGYAAAKDYTDVMLWTSNGHPGQAFKFLPTGEKDGSGNTLYYIYNEATNSYLQPIELRSGSEVIAFRWSGMLHQKWWLEDFGYNLGLGLMLHNAATDETDWCLGAKGSGDGSRLTIDSLGTPVYTQLYAVPLDAINSSCKGDAYTLMIGVTGRAIALSY